MVIGIGTDLMRASRVMDLPLESRFFQAVFTQRERQQASSRNDPLRYYASHFSGKEAVFKALRAHPDQLRLDSIEILNGPTGQPEVILHGTAREHALSIGIQRVLVSLSWEEAYCSAFAAALSE